MNWLGKLLTSLGFVKSRGPQLRVSNDHLDRQVKFEDPVFLGVHSPDRGTTWYDSKTREEIPDPGVVEREHE